MRSDTLAQNDLTGDNRRRERLIVGLAATFAAALTIAWIGALGWGLLWLLRVL